MSKIVLYYFPIKGVAESVRMLLAYGGEGFEDIRISGVDWAALKPSTPFGQVPLLVMNGKKMAQSIAIARYLGHKYGVAGHNIDEDFEIDQNMDFFMEIKTKAAMYQHGSDDATNARQRAVLERNYYHYVLKRLDEIIRQNNGHLALGRLTWADFVFAGLFDYLKVILHMPDLEKKYPSFQQVVDAVCSIPSVKAYIDNVPKPQYY